MTATVAGVAPGQRYYVSVTGATDDVFSVGAYHLVVALPSSTPAAPPLPPTPTSTGTSLRPLPAPAIPPDPSSPTIRSPRRGRSGASPAVVGGVNLNSGLDVDYYRYQTGSGALTRSAPRARSFRSITPAAGTSRAARTS